MRTPKKPSALARLKTHDWVLQLRSFATFRRVPALAVLAVLLFNGAVPTWALARDLAAWRTRTAEPVSAPSLAAPAPTLVPGFKAEAGASGGFSLPSGVNGLPLDPSLLLPATPVPPPPPSTLDVTGTYSSVDMKMTLFQRGDEVWGEWNWIRGRSDSGLPKRLKGRLTGTVLSASWEARDSATAADRGVMALTFVPSATSPGEAASFSATWGTADYSTYYSFTGSKQAAAVKLQVTPESKTLAPGATLAFQADVTNTANRAVTWQADGGTITSDGVFTAPATPGVYSILATSVADPSVWTAASVVVPVTNGISDYSGVYGESNDKRIYLWQSGDALVGDWPYYNRQVAGTLTGSVFTGRWQNNANPADYGQITFTFTTTSTGFTLSGTWGTGASSTGNAISFARSQNVLNLAVSPHLASVAPGAALKLRALVSGHAWQGVRWTATGGTIDGTGTFTSATPGNYTVTATSVADPTKSASAEVCVTGNASPDVSGTWGTDPVVFFQAGNALFGIRNKYNDRFKCTLTGSAMAGQFFYINPPGALRGTVQGTFSGNSFTGSYTAGSSSGPWNLTRAAGVAGIYIPTRTVPLAPGSSLQFTALVSGVADKSVTWAASAGAIAANGTFTAPATAGVVSVTATSVADPTKSCVRLVAVGSGVQQDPAPNVSGTYEGTERPWASQSLYATKLNLYQDGLLVWGTFFSTWNFSSTNTLKGTLNGRYLQATWAVGSPTSYPKYLGITFTLDGASFAGGCGGNGGVTNSTEMLGSRLPGTVSLGTDTGFIPTVPGATVKLNAFVGGTGNRTVTWTASSGSIAADGTFTAPSTEGVSTATATSVLDPTKSFTVQVETVAAGLLPEISGSWDGAGSGLAGPVNFFQDLESISGDWYPSGSTYSGIHAVSGLFRNRVLTGTAVKAGGSPMPFAVAFAPGFGTFKGWAGATFNGWTGTKKADPTVARITPKAATPAWEATQQFLGQIGGTRSKAMTWSATAGTVTSNGLWTAPNLTGNHGVTVTSVADPSKAATAVVTMPAIQVEPRPEYATTRPGGSVNLAAKVWGDLTAPAWSVQEAGGGSVVATGPLSARYTAPATEGLYHVVITSATDPSKKALVTVRVEAAAAVTVTVAPYATQLNKNGTATFTATVEGSSTTGVTWTATAGTIDASGLYTAPNAFGTYTIKATSTADPSAFGIATVVVAAQNGTDKAFTYDENGNMTSDGERTFEWDAENRLVAVVKGNHRSEFGYDGWGRRVVIRELESNSNQSEKTYLWEHTEIAEERNLSGDTAIIKYFLLGFIDSDGTKLFYTRDHLGSIYELTDISQLTRARYQYDLSGRMVKISGDRDSSYGFTGHYKHVISGLDLTFYRAYSSDYGRWLSRDQIGEKDDINMYVYVKNDVINSLDKYGLSCSISDVSYKQDKISLGYFKREIEDPGFMSWLPFINSNRAKWRHWILFEEYTYSAWMVITYKCDKPASIECKGGQTIYRYSYTKWIDLSSGEIIRRHVDDYWEEYSPAIPTDPHNWHP